MASEPIISYHKLIQEDGKNTFKPMSKLNFGNIIGSGESDELKFYIWNNYNGSKDVPNLQLGKISIQSANTAPGIANNETIVDENWLYIREVNNPTWTKLGKDGTVDLEYVLSRTLTGRWNDGEYDDSDYTSNYICMIAKLKVPMNADITLPHIFDVKITGKYV